MRVTKASCLAAWREELYVQKADLYRVNACWDLVFTPQSLQRTTLSPKISGVIRL
ncbi:unnamed protein product [Staurois parvus]|uniref:Uncharacterized protein n=1 Tax=Staurois parvus TaxID=386267 RepID=A0ABN9DAV2_9NEOB|nr:unnamed protein product [Staurois parvus]